MDADFQLMIDAVSDSYFNRTRSTEGIWAGFDSEKRALEERVELAFKEVLKKVDKKDLLIRSTKAEYHPERKDFYFEIVDWAVIKDGKEVNDRSSPEGYGCCAYSHFDGIIDYHTQHPEIVQFKKDFAVRYLSVRECECGSDHR